MHIWDDKLLLLSNLHVQYLFTPLVPKGPTHRHRRFPYLWITTAFCTLLQAPVGRTVQLLCPSKRDFPSLRSKLSDFVRSTGGCYPQ